MPIRTSTTKSRASRWEVRLAYCLSPVSGDSNIGVKMVGKTRRPYCSMMIAWVGQARAPAKAVAGLRRRNRPVPRSGFPHPSHRSLVRRLCILRSIRIAWDRSRHSDPVWRLRSHSSVHVISVVLVIVSGPVGQHRCRACLQWSHGLLSMDDDLWIWNLDPHA